MRQRLANVCAHTNGNTTMNKLTRQEAIERFTRGDIVSLGEYRMSKAEMLNWRDKTNGQAKSAPILRHTVEVGGISIAVNERVPDGTKIEDIHVAFKKGDMVLLEIQELTVDRGLVSARGSLSKVEDSRSPGQEAPVGRGQTR